MKGDTGTRTRRTRRRLSLFLSLSFSRRFVTRKINELENEITRTVNFSYPKGGSAGGGSKRSTQATIVVQQPSLSLDGAPAATILLHPDNDVRRREENMRQLLDVANTLTLQEIHDFEMR